MAHGDIQMYKTSYVAPSNFDRWQPDRHGWAHKEVTEFLPMPKKLPLEFFGLDEIDEEEKENEPMADGTKLIKYYVIDPNRHLPDNMGILATGELLTSGSEQEILIGLGIDKMLEEYNPKRVTVAYEVEDGEKTISKVLPPAKIRDLEIVFSVIKQF